MERNKMNQIDTPRTNAAINASGGQWSFALLDCSSELERELTAVTEQRDALAEALSYLASCGYDGPLPQYARDKAFLALATLTK
jgi:hypothetical protein